MDRDRLNEVRIIRIMPTGQREKGSQSVFLSGSLKPNEHKRNTNVILVQVGQSQVKGSCCSVICRTVGQ